MLIVQTIRGKIIKLFYSVLCMTVVSDMHTHEQFLKLTVFSEILDFFLCAFCHFVPAFAFLVLDLVFFQHTPTDWLGRTSPK